MLFSMHLNENNKMSIVCYAINSVICFISTLCQLGLCVVVHKCMRRTHGSILFAYTTNDTDSIELLMSKSRQ